MDYELRIIVEKVAISSQEVIKRNTITSDALQCPTSIVELGLRHAEQIALLAQVQTIVLAEQSGLLDPGMPVCPACGNPLKKNGYKTSKFHAVFSDHTVRIQKHSCSHPDCGWHRTPTITSLFGTNIHPDLATIQCAQGALYSYREAKQNLAQWNGHPRRVNHHTRVKRMTDRVGAVLAKHNHLAPAAEVCAAPAQDLIIQVDGGHIPIQEKDKRSFEALSAIVYRPEHLQEVDRHHRQIMEKTCVVSALDDQLHTIKTYMVNAANKQGLSQDTAVTALADGAQNCWSVLSAIQRECATFECILDWFHIAQKFQQVKKALGEAFAASLESAKWKLWHGHADDALTKLAVLRDHVPDEGQRSKLTGLYEYLPRNQAYLVNYDTRAQANQTYTSQVAESHIDTLINARHKRTKKMQWTREGAHHVLQIRAMMASDEWESKGQDAVLSALGAAA
jgi:hypothetical protein